MLVVPGGGVVGAVQVKKSDAQYWQWVFVEKGRLQGLRVLQAKGLQPTDKVGRGEEEG